MTRLIWTPRQYGHFETLPVAPSFFVLMAGFDCINVAHSFCGLHVKMKQQQQQQPDSNNYTQRERRVCEFYKIYPPGVMKTGLANIL